MPDHGLELVRFEAEPIHSESYLYGLDFTFTYDIGSIEDPKNHQSFGGRLRVGGLLAANEDIEGVVVSYSATRLSPPLSRSSVQGFYVLQSLTRDKLVAKAETTVQKLRDKELMDSVLDFDPSDMYGRA